MGYDPGLTGEDLTALAIRSNIGNSLMQLGKDSANIETCVQNEGLVIVGAEYWLETGQVDFFEGTPTSVRLGAIERVQIPDSIGFP